jgi:hypothetical protein
MTEAGLLDQIEIIELDQNDEEFERTKETLTERLGKRATFPTVEIEPGRFMNESGDLIDYYAEKNALDVSSLVALPLYEAGLMKRVRELFFTTRAYREKYGEIDVEIP